METSLNHNHKETNNKDRLQQFKRLASMCKISVSIIEDLCNPIDSVNRFVNLTLETVGENSQGRQFLLESKEGLRRTSLLLKRLNDQARRIEKEIRNITVNNE